MLVCPSCGAEHPTDERLCRECGMPLVLAGGERASEPRGLRAQARERARKIIPQYSRGPLVRVAGGRNQAEAELIQNLLLEEGVPSLVRRSAAFDVPDFLAAGPRDVLVPESGAETARELLAEAELVGEGAGAGVAPPDRRRVLTLLAAIAGAALVSALIAWALLGAAG
jgi:hypothetical protein